MPKLIENAPLSRPLALAEVPAGGLDVAIDATPAERAALAGLNNLPEVISFAARLRVRHWRGDGLEVTGEVKARVRRTCVVTLDDFEADIVEPVEARFAPLRDEEPKRRKRQSNDDGTHEAEADAPDQLIGGGVDPGALASEFFTLALDPYPRKPGAAFVKSDTTSGSTPDNVSPFARLRDKKP